MSPPGRPKGESLSAQREGSPASAGHEDQPGRRIDRKTAFALGFWLALAAFIALDWSRATPHNRFDEPPPWALRQPAVEGAGHCAAPLK